MAFIRRGHYAVVVAAVVLVVGMGGVTYAAVQITGADIKDGTIKTADIHDNTLRSADIRDSTLRLRDFSSTAKAGLKGDTGAQGPSDAYAITKTGDTTLTDSFATVLSLDLPAGHYVASVTAIAFEATNGPTFADCVLQDGSGFGESAVTIPAGGTYASVAAQAVFSSGSDSTLTFQCLGSNAGINKVVLTAISVGALHGG